MEYKLKINGDIYEKEAWDLFVKDYFPNYEKFWQKFIIPRTERPDSQDMKLGLSENEQKIIMLHYSIIINLYFVFNDIENAYNRKDFENMYIRLSSATEVFEEFLMLYLIYKDSINFEEMINNAMPKHEFKPLTKDALKIFEKGKNYNLPIISKRSIIKKIPKEKKFSDELDILFSSMDNIRAYRNPIIHSWSMFLLEKECFDSEKIPSEFNYRNWLDIKSKLKNPEQESTTKKNYFIDRKEMIKRDAIKISRLFNSVWNYLCNGKTKEIENMPKNSHPLSISPPAKQTTSIDKTSFNLGPGSAGF